MQAALERERLAREARESLARSLDGIVPSMQHAESPSTLGA
jgi:hypothetical protein